jgi:hypothetical protein
MLTNEQKTAIAEKLRDMHLPSGLGDEENACSIAAINLALTGKLTDAIPACMSEVIGKWIITTQDSMPDEMRNSDRWKSLLPLAAGTGRDKEKERLAIILDWMWGTVLPTLQPLADKEGFGAEWKRMTEERTKAAAKAAWAVAAAAKAAWAVAAARAAAGAEAAWVGAWAAEAWAAWVAARAAANAAGEAARAAAGKDSWEAFDPPALLDRLIRA